MTATWRSYDKSPRLILRILAIHLSFSVTSEYLDIISSTWSATPSRTRCAAFSTSCSAHSSQRAPTDGFRKADPDAGAWKHDLHQNPRQSLASRLSTSSSRPSLLNRMSGSQGKELFPTGSVPKLHGFDERPPVNPMNPNSGLELLPGTRRRADGRPGSVVQPGQRSLLDAALGRGVRQQVVRPVTVQPQHQQQQPQGVSIMGAARGTTWVRVEHLALGTTAEDVIVRSSNAPKEYSRPDLSHV